jgi:hypothetical protein
MKDKWHIVELLDRQIDPYGSTTIHGIVVKAIVGSHYETCKKVDIISEQVFVSLLIRAYNGG